MNIVFIYLFCSVPKVSRDKQSAYLVSILSGMRDQSRIDFCLSDNNVQRLLLSQCFNKLRGAGATKNVRSLANTICRFFEPLMESLDVTTTSEILVSDHSQLLFDSLVEFGGISEFFENPDEFVDAIKTNKVSLFEVMK